MSRMVLIFAKAQKLFDISVYVIRHTRLIKQLLHPVVHTSSFRVSRQRRVTCVAQYGFSEGRQYDMLYGTIQKYYQDAGVHFSSMDNINENNPKQFYEQVKSVLQFLIKLCALFTNQCEL